MDEITKRIQAFVSLPRIASCPTVAALNGSARVQVVSLADAA